MVLRRLAFTTFCQLRHAALVANLRVAIALSLALTFSVPAHAQCAAGWVPGIGAPGLNGSSVYATAVLPGGDVIVGGDFFQAGGVPANNIARYNPTTGVWSPLGSGMNFRVYALAVLPDGDVVAGGNFTAAGGVPANLLARYNPTSGIWSPMGLALSGGAVNALAVLPDGNIVVGGRELNTGAGPAANNIARYSPSTGLWSPLGGGVDSDVYAVTVMQNGDVLAGGRFFSAGGVTVRAIARFNFTALTWSPLGTGVNDFGNVYAVSVLPGGDIIAGGRFATIGGVSASRIARYNPTAGTWSALGSGVQDQFPTVYSLLVLPSGDMVVGGFFSGAGGAPAANIARYNFSTGIWSALGSGMNSTVLSLTPLPGGDAIASGFFTTAGGPVANFVARYSFGAAGPTIDSQPESQTVCPTGSANFSVTASGAGPITYQWQWQPAPGAPFINMVDGLNTDPEGGPITFTAQDSRTSTVVLEPTGGGGTAQSHWDQRCIVTNACGSTTSDPATLSTCIGDSDCDGDADSDDIITFFSAWDNGDTDGDADGDGDTDSDDIIVFFNSWDSGC